MLAHWIVSGEVAIVALASGAAYFVFMFAFAAAGGMGMGDVKLAGVLGLAPDWSDRPPRSCHRWPRFCWAGLRRSRRWRGCGRVGLWAAVRAFRSARSCWPVSGSGVAAGAMGRCPAPPQTIVKVLAPSQC